MLEWPVLSLQTHSVDMYKMGMVTEITLDGLTCEFVAVFAVDPISEKGVSVSVMQSPAV